MFDPDHSPEIHSIVAIEAMANFLASEFTSTTRSRGNAYAKQGAVLKIWEKENTVVGQVQGTESEPYVATLIYEGTSWISECSCPVEFDCKHGYAVGKTWLHTTVDHQRATAIERLKTMASPSKFYFPSPSLKKTKLVSFRDEWSAELATQIGRSLTDQENRLLGHLSALFHEFRQYGQITRDTLYRHQLSADDSHPGQHFNKPAFPGWWPARNPPRTPWELWQYIALHWEQAGRPLPAAFLPVTDTSKIRDAVDQIQLASELEPWRETALPQYPGLWKKPPAADLAQTYPELRLRLRSTGTVHVEARADPEKPWRMPTKQWLNSLAMAEWSSFDGFAPAPRRLAFALRLTADYHQLNLGPQGRIDIDFLAAFLNEPEPNPIVVLPDETPFRIEQAPLKLLAQPDPGDSRRLLLKFIRPDGSTAPTNLKPFTTDPHPLYLIDDRVWRGPLPPPSFRLPVSGLDTPEVADKLKQLGVVLPQEIEDSFVTLRLKPRLRCWVDHSDTRGYSHDVLQVQLIAECAEPACAQEWRGDQRWHWIPGREPPPGPPSQTRRYVTEMAETQRVTDAFYSSAFHYITRENNWQAAAMDGLPQRFELWRSQLPPDIAIEVSPELAGLVSEPLRARVTATARADEKSGTDWFDVTLELKADDLTLTATEMDLLLAARGRWVRLARRGWQRLEVDSTVDPALVELGLEIDPQRFSTTAAKGETHRFHALQLASVDFVDPDLTTRLRERAAELKSLPPPPPPAGLDATLRPYQQDGYHYLAHLATQGLGGVLADDMGLGKTVQTLAWLLWLRDLRLAAAPTAPFRVLVVCPKSVVPNWQNETARFSPSLTTARLEPRGALPEDSSLLILNYTQMRLRAETLAAVNWDAVILDEGQNIKTPNSATARAARDLPARHRVVLTGTPIENRLLDLWSLLAFAQPGLLGTQASFQRLYNDKRDPEGARSRLATRTRPFLLRRTKQQVASDLPDRSEKELICELEGPQRTLYDAELKRARQLLLDVKTDRQFDSSRFNILQSLLRLRQICCDPRLISPDNKKPSSAKLDALLETIESVASEGHRLLVFSQFVGMLELIRDALAARNIAHLLLTGQTENRQELVDTFQAADGPPVFLLSLKAAGSGLNLTAASYVVLYDPWWNPAVEAQAIDRTHRIGQTANVIAYRLIAKDTIEEKIRLLQHEKAAMAAAVVQEESLTKVMDLDTLRHILS